MHLLLSSTSITASFLLLFNISSLLSNTPLRNISNILYFLPLTHFLSSITNQTTNFNVIPFSFLLFSLSPFPSSSQILDKDKSGVVEVNDIASCYDASKHPDVIAKKRAPTDILRYARKHIKIRHFMGILMVFKICWLFVYFVF